MELIGMRDDLYATISRLDFTQPIRDRKNDG